MSEVVIYLESDDLDKIQEELEKSFIPRDQDLIDITEKLEDEANRTDEVIKEFATISATEVIKDNVFDITMLAIKKACFDTVEYNYHLYVERLQEAVKSNFSKIITLEFKFERPTITVDFSVLGDPSMWFQAVDRVKGEGEFGLENEVGARSRMWAEKIYKTAREGRKLTRKKYKKNKETGEMELSKEYDITDRYKIKYDQTISSRLSLIPQDKAPFWHFIEFGNASFGRGGKPYPKLAPHPMSRAIQIQLNDMYNTAYNIYEEKAREIIDDLFNKEEIEKAIAEDLARYKEEIIIDDYTTGIQKEFNTLHEKYREIRKEGLVYAERRVRGRYATQPEEWKQMAREQRNILRQARRG